MYGYFVKVGEFELPFIDLPLEVGANIKDGTCYITQKVSPSNWNYYGYRFDKVYSLIQKNFHQLNWIIILLTKIQII
jgi:hypothetical protein